MSVEVKRFTNRNDGSYIIDIQDDSIFRRIIIDKNSGVNVFPVGWYSETGNTKLTVDPESAVFKTYMNMFLEEGASEDDAFALTVYILWELTPKASIDTEVDESVIDELIINRAVSYGARNMLEAIIYYYIDCISGEKPISERFTGENSIRGLMDFIINANALQIKKAIKDYPDAVEFTEGKFYNALTELKIMCMDIISRPDKYNIGAPIEVIAYRAAIFDALLQRMGIDLDDVDQDDESLYMNKNFTFRLGDSYAGEEGGEEFRRIVYEIADRLGVSRDEIVTFVPRKYMWYDETCEKIVDIYNRAAFPAEIFKDDEEVMAEVERDGDLQVPFTDETDCNEFVAAVIPGVPYDRGKRANIQIRKTYSSRDGFCSTQVYIEIINDYLCLDEQGTIMVSKECYENCLNICGGSFIPTDDMRDGDFYLYGENQDEEYISNKDNYIRLNLNAVLNYCDDPEQVIRILHQQAE